jgi:hypothetical protein
MIEEISWDIPSQRTRKEEKFGFSVLTMAALEKAGSNRKMSFNKAAIEELELVGGESVIRVGYKNEDKRVVITKHPEGFKLARNNSFSDKRTFEYIAKLLSLDVNVENNFELVKQENPAIFELILVEESKAMAKSVVEESQVPHANYEIPSLEVIEENSKSALENAQGIRFSIGGSVSEEEVLPKEEAEAEEVEEEKVNDYEDDIRSLSSESIIEEKKEDEWS